MTPAPGEQASCGGAENCRLRGLPLGQPTPGLRASRLRWLGYWPAVRARAMPRKRVLYAAKADGLTVR